MAAPRISIWLARLVAREGLQRLVDAFKVLGVLRFADHPFLVLMHARLRQHVEILDVSLQLVDLREVVLEGLELIREKLGNDLEGALLVVKIGLVRNDLRGGFADVGQLVLEHELGVVDGLRLVLEGQEHVREAIFDLVGLQLLQLGSFMTCFVIAALSP